MIRVLFILGGGVVCFDTNIGCVCSLVELLQRDVRSCTCGEMLKGR